MDVADFLTMFEEKPQHLLYKNNYVNLYHEGCF